MRDIEQYLQIKAINLGMNYVDFIVLCFLKENVLRKSFKAKEIQDRYPIFIKSSMAVKTSIEKLQELDFLKLTIWDKGNFTIQCNPVTFIGFYINDIDNVPKVVISKPVVKKEDNTNSFSPEENEIINHYKGISTLPRVVNITPKRAMALKKALENYSVVDIKKALDFAGKQEWLASKSDETWCDMAWILNKIGEFMPNGKYNKTNKAEIIVPFGKKSTAVFL